MSNMIRKQIYLEERQVRAIQQRSEVLGVNESELIRHAIDRTLFGGESIPSRPDPSAWDEIEVFLVSQSDESQYGEPYQFNREEIYAERLGRLNGTDTD